MWQNALEQMPYTQVCVGGCSTPEKTHMQETVEVAIAGTVCPSCRLVGHLDCRAAAPCSIQQSRSSCPKASALPATVQVVLYKPATAMRQSYQGTNLLPTTLPLTALLVCPNVTVAALRLWVPVRECSVLRGVCCCWCQVCGTSC